jgi:drug/metabolite transporter (DMT)-like permease
MNARDFLLLLLLGALFGAAFLFMRMAVPSFGPITLIAVRVLLAAGVLAAFARLRSERVRFGGSRRAWLLLGALNAAIPFTLIAWAELHIASSLAAILIATMPLFTALAAALWQRERIGLARGVGLALGLVGVLILSGWDTAALDGTTLLAIGAVLLASLSYAVGNVYTKVRFAEVPRLTLTVGNFLFAGLLLLPLVAVAPAPALPPLGAWGAMAALVVLATVIPFLLFYRLLARSAATTASSVAFLIPGFGTLWGVLFLNEAVGAATLIGFAVVLVGVALVTGSLPRRAPRPRRAPVAP